MERNFCTGIIIGIIIGIFGTQMFVQNDVSAPSKTSEIQTRTSVAPNPRYYDDEDFDDFDDREFDYADYSMHER